jgi:hypothetical protein
MSSAFDFEEWCAVHELSASTRRWLETNGCASLTALRGLQRSDVAVGGDGGVDTIGEKSKMFAGIGALRGTSSGTCFALVFSS